MSRQLVEISSTLIRDMLKIQMPIALADVRTDRADAKVTTEPPQSYFFYEKADPYRTPGIFIIATNIDFRKEDQSANFINATTTYQITCVIEDRAEEYLTIKSWRYQAALHQCLDQTQLEDLANNVKITIVVRSASFSPTFTTAGTDPNVFRREVLLECDVYHYENF